MMSYNKQTFNLTTHFVMPLLDIHTSVFKVANSSLNNTRFVNSYLFDESITDYQDDHIFLMHHNYQDTLFDKFEKILTSNPNYVDGYDICDTKLAIKIFKIPSEHIADYQYFKQGLYSKFSKSAIDKIINNNFSIDSLSKRKWTQLIFQKDDLVRQYQEERLSNPGSPVSLENNEVWTIYEPSKNILSIDLKSTLFTTSIQPTPEKEWSV